jgi:hypothetical protein
MKTTNDLSTVTDRIIKLIEDAVGAWPEWIGNNGPVQQFNLEVSPLMPEAVRNKADCQLSFYLFHVQPDPSVRNWPPSGKVAQPNASQPLGLTLFYLLTAYSKESAIQEQQAMSIAIQALHEYATYNDPTDQVSFTITLDAERSDDANRRWQSFSAPYRLAVAYRVGVVLLTPDKSPPAPAPPPRTIGLGVGPATLPFGTAGALAGTASRVELTPANPQPTSDIEYDYSPAVVRPGDQLTAFGAGLDLATASRLYLLDPAAVETEITAWKAAAAQQTASRLVATLPSAVGAMPANSPLPGIYQLRVGSSTGQGDVADYRSNATPISIAARTAAVPSPWPGPPFSFAGDGFIPGATELYLDTTSLTETGAAAAGSGEFKISVNGTSIHFQPPAGMPAGQYSVRLRVRGVEGPPIGRVELQ